MAAVSASLLPFSTECHQVERSIESSRFVAHHGTTSRVSCLDERRTFTFLSAFSHCSESSRGRVPPSGASASFRGWGSSCRCKRNLLHRSEFEPSDAFRHLCLWPSQGLATWQRYSSIETKAPLPDDYASEAPHEDEGTTEDGPVKPSTQNKLVERHGLKNVEPGMLGMLGPKSQKLAKEKAELAALSKILTEFRYVGNLRENVGREGHFVVQMLTDDFLLPAVDLLTVSFAEVLGITYEPLLRYQAMAYVRTQRLLIPHGITLIGMWQPTSASTSEMGQHTSASSSEMGQPTGASLSEMGQSQAAPAADVPGMGERVEDREVKVEGGAWEGALRGSAIAGSTGVEEQAMTLAPELVGTVEVSFNTRSRPKFLTLDPPEHGVYLCNMAVHARWRRQGAGAQLLQAAEALAAAMGKEDVFLHCRIMDSAPKGLYLKTGYTIVSTDNFLCYLFFQRRRHLMQKRLKRAASLQDSAPDEVSALESPH